MFQFDELRDIVSDAYIEDEERLEHLNDLFDDVFNIRSPRVSVKYEIDANDLDHDQDQDSSDVIEE
jgi:hypothetical protein